MPGWHKSRLNKEKAPNWRLVFLRKHDREHTCRLARVSGIFRSPLAVDVVVVDLPKELLVENFKAAEVVLAVWIVISGEVLEGLHRKQRLGFYIDRKLADAGGQQESAADECRAEVIIENANPPRVCGC